MLTRKNGDEISQGWQKVISERFIYAVNLIITDRRFIKGNPRRYYKTK